MLKITPHLKTLAVAVSLSVAPLSQADSLLQIYQLAQTNDPTIRSAEAELNAGLQNAAINRAGLLPSVSLSASSSSQIDGEDSSTGWSASLSQTLFDLPSWYTYRQGVNANEQAEIIWQAAQQDLVTRSVTAYLSVLRAIDNLETSLAEKKAIASQLDQTQQRFEVGLVARTDVLDAQAAYDDALAGEIEATGNLGIAFESLTVLTGQEHLSIAPLREDYPVATPTPNSASEWAKLANESSTSLMVAELNKDTAELTSKSRRAEFLPSVNLSLGYSDDFSGSLAGAEGSSLTVSASVPLYSGGSNIARMRQTAYLLDQAEEDLNGTRRNLEQSVRSLYVLVTTNISQINAQLQAIESSEAALEATRAGYDVGTRNLVDVLLAEQTYYQARRTYLNTRYDYILNMITLKETAGVLGPNDLESLNQWLDASAEIAKSIYLP